MKIYVEVFGCTANKSDAALVKGLIKKSKHSLVEKIDDADIIIILTCTVIDTTEQRMLSRIKKFKELNKKMIVGGCMASVQKEKIKKISQKILFLPPEYVFNILDLINNKKTIFKQQNKTKFDKLFKAPTAPISIAEGCMFACSYCITTIARGKLRSYPINEIKKDVKSALDYGCKEIQLTAQDTSSYGMKSNIDLGILIKNISELQGDFFIRVGMMNPYTCLKNINSIINSFDDSKVFKFIHLPLQSGDDDILEKMNRKYTTKQYLGLVDNFKKRYPDISLATDIIAGFPGETDAQFEKSIRILKTIKPDITNITRFSARPYTKAKTMKNRIKTEIVKQRSKKLSQICMKISKEKNQEHIGKKYNILILEKGKNNTYVGRTYNYKPVVIDKKSCIGEYIKVKITGAESTYLVGSII